MKLRNRPQLPWKQRDQRHQRRPYPLETPAHPAHRSGQLDIGAQRPSSPFHATRCLDLQDHLLGFVEAVAVAALSPGINPPSKRAVSIAQKAVDDRDAMVAMMTWRCLRCQGCEAILEAVGVVSSGQALEAKKGE